MNPSELEMLRNMSWKEVFTAAAKRFLLALSIVIPVVVVLIAILLLMGKIPIDIR